MYRHTHTFMYTQTHYAHMHVQVAVDIAAGLGYALITQYLIRNWCLYMHTYTHIYTHMLYTGCGGHSSVCVYVCVCMHI
jgi:hypothetical protein